MYKIVIVLSSFIDAICIEKTKNIYCNIIFPFLAYFQSQQVFIYLNISNIKIGNQVKKKTVLYTNHIYAIFLIRKYYSGKVWM